MRPKDGIIIVCEWHIDCAVRDALKGRRTIGYRNKGRLSTIGRDSAGSSSLNYS